MGYEAKAVEFEKSSAFSIKPQTNRSRSFASAYPKVFSAITMGVVQGLAVRIFAPARLRMTCKKAIKQI